MREGTTSRVTAADRPYGEFDDFYSVSPENFGSTLVYTHDQRSINKIPIHKPQHDNFYLQLGGS
jgi:hypothetical protein